VSTKDPKNPRPEVVAVPDTTENEPDTTVSFVEGVSDQTVVDDEEPFFLELREDGEYSEATINTNLEPSDLEAILSESVEEDSQTELPAVSPLRGDILGNHEDEAPTTALSVPVAMSRVERAIEVHAPVSTDFADGDQETEIEEADELLLELQDVQREASLAASQMNHSVLDELRLPQDFSDSVDGVELFGSYLLLKQLGIGGMSEVRLAFRMANDLFSHACVVKRVFGDYLQDQSILQMFEDESRLGALLHHPNIVRQYESGSLNSIPFIAMELVDGTNLSTFVKWYPEPELPLQLVLEISKQVAEGLYYAHTAIDESESVSLEIIHRDVTPQNILIDRDGSVKLVDFGLARFSGRTYHTSVGPPKGKAGYFAPEQLRNEALSNRIDIFALGVVMIELCIGRSLFDRNVLSVNNIETHVREALARAPTRLPAGLTELLVRMTAEDPMRRPATAQEVALLIEMIQEALVSTQSLDVVANEVMNAHLPPISDIIQEFFRWSKQGPDGDLVHTVQESGEFSAASRTHSNAMKLMGSTPASSPELPGFFPTTADFVVLANAVFERPFSSDAAPVFEQRVSDSLMVKPVLPSKTPIALGISASSPTPDEINSMTSNARRDAISASSPTPGGRNSMPPPVRQDTTAYEEVPAWLVVVLVLFTAAIGASAYAFIRMWMA